MQNSKRKTSDKLRFRSPYWLEDCLIRLESKTQPTEFGLWKERTRIRVRTWLDDEDTALFRIHLMPKGSLQWQIPHPAVNVTGKLFRQADGTTAVEMDIRNNVWALIAYLFGIFVLFSGWMFFTGLVVMKGNTQILALPWLTGWGFAGIAVPFFNLKNDTWEPLVRLVARSLTKSN